MHRSNLKYTCVYIYICLTDHCLTFSLQYHCINNWSTFKQLFFFNSFMMKNLIQFWQNKLCVVVIGLIVQLLPFSIFYIFIHPNITETILHHYFIWILRHNVNITSLFHHQTIMTCEAYRCEVWPSEYVTYFCCLFIYCLFIKYIVVQNIISSTSIQMSVAPEHNDYLHKKCQKHCSCYRNRRN